LIAAKAPHKFLYSYISYMKKSVKKFIWFGIFIILGYFLARYVFIGPKVVPNEFLEARTNGEKIAVEIVDLSSGSINNLSQISKLDKEFNYPEALVLVSSELIKNGTFTGKATELSTELARMAQTIQSIRPAKARELAAEAVSYEVALVSRLIGYNQALKELMGMLKSKFSWEFYGTDSQVEELLIEINGTATAINSLNAAFEETLKDFDEVFVR